MKITPLDIQKKEFQNGFRGYRPEEVDEYLDLIAESLEEVLQENVLLRDRMKDLEGRIDEYRRMEKNLEKTLLTAQELSDQMKTSAEKEIELKREQARMEAERIIEQAARQAESMEKDIQSLRTEKVRFKAQMRLLIEEHLALLTQTEEQTKEKGGPVTRITPQTILNEK